MAGSIQVGLKRHCTELASYLCIEPHTYVARIATRTPPPSPERPAPGAGCWLQCWTTKKESTVSDLCAALEKVVLAADPYDEGMYGCLSPRLLFYS